MERGIIITPDYDILDHGHGLRINGAVNPLNLRQYLLFWDRIDFPTNNMIHTGGGNDVDFLIQEGIAKSSAIQFDRVNGNENGFIFLAAQMAAYEKNNESEQEEWSIAQPTQRLYVPNQYAQTQGCLEFELYDAVSIPTADVPLADICEFKLKRNDELLALRDSMDSIVDSILNSQNIPKRKNKAISKLHRDLNDFNRAISETKFERISRSLKTIATDPWFGVAGAGALVKDYLPDNYQPFVQALNVAALGGCALKFAYNEIKVGRTIPDNFKQFAYLSSIKRELA